MVIMDKEKINSTSKKKQKNKQPVKKVVNKPKKKIIFHGLLCLLFIILTTVTDISFVFSQIFGAFANIIYVLISLLIMFISYKILTNIKLRKWVKNVYSVLVILISIIEIIFLVYGIDTLKFLASVTDTGYRIETYGIYSIKTNNYNKIKDLNNKVICYLDNNDDLVPKVTKKIDKQINVKYEKEEKLDQLIKDMNSKCDAILVSSSYEAIINEEFEEQYYNMKKIEEIDIVTMVKTIKSDRDIGSEPFAIYISGIDSNGNIASSSRSDVNIIMAVNPKKHEILLVNTPRDYYITLPSKKKMDKLTHAGIYGVEESLKSLSDLYNIDIDYYVRINFKSFMKMIDAIDGIEVDVRNSFCEQNSKRSFLKKDLICLTKGKQKLNGEQALAYARHRKSYALKDRVRGENQMQIITAMVDKVTSPKIISNYRDIIKSLEGYIVTNMTTSEMYRFGRTQVKNGFNWTVKSISAEGEDAREVCYSTGTSKVYVMKPTTSSINEIKQAFNEIFN